MSYTFKHALVQETAYQALLKSTPGGSIMDKLRACRSTKFPETAQTQPELLAHHYAEAALLEQAVRY